MRSLLVTSNQLSSLPVTWTTRDGSVVKIKNMTDSHIRNTHRKLVKGIAKRGSIMDYIFGDVKITEQYIIALEREMSKREVKPFVRLCDCSGGFTVPLDYSGEELEYLVGEICDVCNGDGYVSHQKKGGNNGNNGN